MWSSAVQKRSRVKQTSPLDQRLTDQAQRLRKEAKGTPPGVERERLLRRARQAEAAAHMERWLTRACPEVKNLSRRIPATSCLLSLNHFETSPRRITAVESSDGDPQ